MLAIYKRELRSYFTTPIGYIFLAVYFLFSAAVFSYTTLFSYSSDVSGYFEIMILLLAIMLPLLTMKQFSEEKKQKTDQLLLTSPISVLAMVSGKFLASYTIFAGATVFSSLSFIILTIYADIQVSLLLGNIVALLLVGLAFIAIGIFISSITESQLSAAVCTVAVIAALMFISLINSLISVYFIRFIFSSVSVFSRFQNFTQGVFDVAALFYYISVAAVFLFLTVCVFERRRRA